MALASSRIAQASKLAPSIKVATGQARTVNGVTFIGAQESLAGAPSSFTVTMTNGGGAPLTYIVGQGTNGLVPGAFLSGFAFTFTQPTAWTGNAVAAAQDSFRDLPVLVKRLLFDVSVASNLNQAVNYVRADVNGAIASIPVNLREGLMPDQFINTRLVLDFAVPFALNGRSGFTFTVPNGTSTVVTFGVEAAAGR